MFWDYGSAFLRLRFGALGFLGFCPGSWVTKALNRRILDIKVP